MTRGISSTGISLRRDTPAAQVLAKYLCSARRLASARGFLALHGPTLADRSNAVGCYGYRGHGACDAGAAAPGKLGGCRSRVIGIGPQATFFFPVGNKVQGVGNVKVYDEFAAENRPSG